MADVIVVMVCSSYMYVDRRVDVTAVIVCWS